MYQEDFCLNYVLHFRCVTNVQQTHEISKAYKVTKS